MPKFASHLFLATLMLLFAQRTAAAHSSLESTLSFWVRATGIDVQIYMSRGSAAALLEKPGEHLTIIRENFPEFEDRLAANAPALLSLASSDGTALNAQSSTATITDEDDICYHLHYPLPNVLPGSLEIHGNYLARMDDGHIGSIYVLSATDDLLAQGDIRADSPDFEVQLPALSGANAPAPIPSVNQSPHATRWALWTIVSAVILIILIVALRGIARQSLDRKAIP